MLFFWHISALQGAVVLAGPFFELSRKSRDYRTYNRKVTKAAEDDWSRTSGDDFHHVGMADRGHLED